MGRDHGRQKARVAQTRSVVGLVSDLGGAAVALSMAIAGLVGIGSVGLGLVNDQPGIVMFGIGVMSGVGLGSLLMHLAAARVSASVEAQRGYRWIQATYTYSVDATDHHLHAQVVDVEIEALRNGVRAFTNQYRWSGSGIDRGPIVQSPGHSLSGPSRRSLGWRSYVVNLDPALRKGQRTVVSVLQELNDEDERFDPFLAKAVHETMDQLILRVQLPPSLTPQRIWRIARDGAGPEARETLRTLATAAENGLSATIEWSIPKPVIGLNYELYWDYGNDNGLYDVRDVREPGLGPQQV
jgi:hypothetical protein